MTFGTHSVFVSPTFFYKVCFSTKNL